MANCEHKWKWGDMVTFKVGGWPGGYEIKIIAVLYCETCGEIKKNYVKGKGE